MLRSSLRSVFAADLGAALEAAGAKETQRAEELTVEQFQILARNLGATIKAN
jgi:16S rRNA A1518/A1519 N6-dimethyltransferase RsmA/KsgA/DIM1 with predicted DNA glycosylase/AP lyase activity